MTIKQKVIVFLIVIIAITSYGLFIENFQDKKNVDEINNWLNAWVNETIEMRKTYHSKIDSIQVVEINPPKDYYDVDKMKAFNNCLEQVLEAELWKFDKGLEIDNNWIKKLDPSFDKKYPEQITFLKDQLNKGINEATKFRIITINYVNDQVSFINFLLEKNCILNQSDETMYNNFALKIENSYKIYTDAVSNIYNISLQRVKEFNLHFKNENLDKLIDIIPDGIIDVK